MPRFSANISMMFLEHDPLDRVQAVRDAGFEGVEIQFPYDIPATDWVTAKERAGVEFAVINLPAGDLAAGGPGLAAMPGRETEFRDGVKRAKDYAALLRPRNVNVLAGWPPKNLGRDRCLGILADNLAFAAAEMEEVGSRVTVEAINTRDRPASLVTTSSESIAIIDRAGHPNLAIQHDLYHMQIMEGDLIPTLERVIGRVGHIQFADTPARHEPGTGEIAFADVFAAIDRLGYDGWVGAEYDPSGRTEDSLGWLQPYL
ncbi:MAG: TIM barrel protein [Proteobacteria bacterium]|nr:TIM barrel protein [Pseudomonadota bacterium]